MQSKTAETTFTLTSGPVDAYPAVLRALSRPVLYDYDPAFLQFYEAVNEKAQRAMHLSTPPTILHGEPVLGLEAAAASLIGRDDVVLNLASGVYGKGFGFWAKRYCADLIEIEVPYNEAIDQNSVKAALATRSSVCHHDTPSGTINPVAEIGAMVARHGGYMIVDAVSSFGGMKIDAESCHADIFVTGPNKCLGCPPGLTLMGISDRAWIRMKNNALAPRASMLSILDWEEAWRAERPFPFTPSVSEIYALDAALDLYLAEGACHDRHRLADHHGRAAAAGDRGRRATGCDARSLWRHGLVRARRDAWPAHPHRSHGTDGAAALRRCGARGARRCARSPRAFDRHWRRRGSRNADHRRGATA